MPVALNVAWLSRVRGALPGVSGGLGFAGGEVADEFGLQGFGPCRPRARLHVETEFVDDGRAQNLGSGDELSVDAGQDDGDVQLVVRLGAARRGGVSLIILEAAWAVGDRHGQRQGRPGSQGSGNVAATGEGVRLLQGGDDAAGRGAPSLGTTDLDHDDVVVVAVGAQVRCGPGGVRVERRLPCPARCGDGFSDVPWAGVFSPYTGDNRSEPSMHPELERELTGAPWSVCVRCGRRRARACPAQPIRNRRLRVLSAHAP